MIHFFTDPYEDELIYSAISRYHFYTGNLDYKDTIEECFGKRTIVPTLELGSPIEELAKNIGGKYTSDYLINKHTIMPYYKPFLSTRRYEEIINDIKYENCSVIYNKIGITAGSVCRKSGIYYCPICSRKDIALYGEAYIHREHQLQGIFLCPHHGEILKKYKIIRYDVSRLEFIRLEKELLDFESETKSLKYQEVLLKLSKDAYYLLQNDFINVDKKVVLEKYRNLLNEKGLTTSSNRIKQIELYEEFIHFYGEDLLKLMNSSINKDNEYNWLRVITRDLKRVVHPIRHLLLINFLSGNIDEFFSNIKDKYNPFGKGPWPCLNIAAKHYRNNVIRDLKITDDSKSRVPVGTFTCKCGFIYSRRGPDKESKDRYKIGRIKNFGKVWKDKLKAYFIEGKHGLRELARLMNCDSKTILKFDFLLQTNRFENNSKYIKLKKAAANADYLNKYRNTILDVMKSNTGATRNEIRSMCQKEYTYIYRRDKNWLLNNLPNTIKITSHHSLVDWNKRDNEILQIIKNKYDDLMEKNEKIRITKSSMGRMTGSLIPLEKNIDKLPKTKKYLAEIIETVEEFQIRRCKIVINDKIDKGEAIKLWEIQRISGIRSEAFKKIKESVLTYIALQTNRGIYE